MVTFTNVDNTNVLQLDHLEVPIYTARMREYLIRSGISLVDDLQKETIRYVSARNQAKIISYLINTKYLTDREINIVKRGRNYKKNRHPRHTDIITYKLSTGFETLIGYLYLNNEKKRVEEIIVYILGGPYEENI